MWAGRSCSRAPDQPGDAVSSQSYVPSSWEPQLEKLLARLGQSGRAVGVREQQGVMKQKQVTSQKQLKSASLYSSRLEPGRKAAGLAVASADVGALEVLCVPSNRQCLLLNLPWHNPLLPSRVNCFAKLIWACKHSRWTHCQGQRGSFSSGFQAQAELERSQRWPQSELWSLHIEHQHKAHLWKCSQSTLQHWGFAVFQLESWTEGFYRHPHPSNGILLLTAKAKQQNTKHKWGVGRRDVILFFFLEP